ncbi:MAG: hypothetical protein IJ027_03680 [Oscillospiraceae bacterium]|nr:hypothetical protein [Oscillospiraceae bacterium]
MNVNGYCEEYEKYDKCDKCEDYGKEDKYDDYDKHDKDDKREKCDCDKKAEQVVDISVPIEVCPEADLGKIETECCGKPKVECEQEPCGSSVSIIITQSVKIKIPVKFGIKTIEGNSFIKCCDKHCD